MCPRFGGWAVWRFAGLLAGWLAGRLVGWLAGRLAGGLVGWLAGWQHPEPGGFWGILGIPEEVHKNDFLWISVKNIFYV